MTEGVIHPQPMKPRGSLQTLMTYVTYELVQVAIAGVITRSGQLAKRSNLDSRWG